ncbi:low molecular weight protein-tyrosine-phosphatase [Roseibium sp.]|uniref:low molecular weight protein-tyrosine-phosphatase n=1 Tax=Roseibium sp. TaxID=1936156 RepID=UPI003D12D58B
MPQSVLFVCLGNICRSPLAEGVFRALVQETAQADRFFIDSAGTGAWHVGNPPDPRSVETAARHGVDISMQRARKVHPGDFTRFDTIVAMDGSNLSTLQARAGGGVAELRLLLTNPQRDVPDPYYGGPDGFETVYRLVHTGCRELLETLSR